jgi:hypothetical protein
MGEGFFRDTMPVASTISVSAATKGAAAPDRRSHMRHARLMSGLVLMAMTVVAKPGSAQVVLPGPYYATAAWDLTLSCKSLSNCGRFIVLANMGGAAVLDRETGLVWERSPSTDLFTWHPAHTHCNEFVTIGNRLGWRLPSVQELASLIDPLQADPALPPGHPFTDVQLTDRYFTSTADSRNTDNKWTVGFAGDGDLANGMSGNIAERKYAWCVRGGSGPAEQ